MYTRITLFFVYLLLLFLPQAETQTISCGEPFYDSGGPDANYGSSESMEWNICPDIEGEVVVIDFTLIDLEAGYDFLGVYSGIGTNDRIDARVVSPEAFTSFSVDGCLTVTFQSDASVQLAGWEA